MMAVASNATAGIVGKLTYQSRGPFEIVKDLSFSAYTVRSLGKPDATTCKYPPLDTSDFRYMNSGFSPLLDTLKANPLNIESYNSMWYTTIPCTHPPKFDYSPLQHL
eukprot:scaffold4330_cov38-Attheya_sp.AAC.3